MRAFVLASLLAVAVGEHAQAEPADPQAAIDLRRDVLAYHVSRGATVAQACAAVLRYFGGVCRGTRDAVVIADKENGDTTFYAVLNLEAP